ncbi:MAG TPA: efflux RND transporter periplasmic adaptor subunit [Longimicrobiaceae bacterium]|nr:efflux RND transporter periplasmic adaptor subunit [Longimicrobiaceae bacterium]
MIRSRRTLGIAAALVAVLALSTAIYARIRGEGEDAESASAESSASASASGAPGTSASGTFATDVAIPVQGTEAGRGTLVVAVSAAGQAEAWKRAIVTAQVTGRIAGLPVRESDGVGAGQAVVALDPAEYALAVQEAQAAVRDAEARYREQTLFDERITDAATREERAKVARAKSGLEGAEVRLRRAQLDLQRTRLGAPFAGRIADVKVVPGQWVQQGAELMTVVDLDPIRVEVQVLESEVGFLAPGRTARVSFAAFPTEPFTGRVETINPVVESGTRTARVTVLVPNPQGRILPGMYARVSLDARRFENRVLVPRTAILERDRRTMLFVYDGDERGGLAKWRYVTTGLQNESQVEIVPSEETDSVAPGETVLTDGHYTLIHDARVRLVDDVKKAGGRPQ